LRFNGRRSKEERKEKSGKEQKVWK